MQSAISSKQSLTERIISCSQSLTGYFIFIYQAEFLEERPNPEVIELSAVLTLA